MKNDSKIAWRLARILSGATVVMLVGVGNAHSGAIDFSKAKQAVQENNKAIQNAWAGGVGREPAKWTGGNKAVQGNASFVTGDPQREIRRAGDAMIIERACPGRGAARFVGEAVATRRSSENRVSVSRDAALTATGAAGKGGTVAIAENSLAVGDADADGFNDERDNCPEIANGDQGDRDSDGIGDACDNCESVANPDQGDWNNDCRGNACQDFDGDDINDDHDNCLNFVNPDQVDLNGNGIGDACDPECVDPELTIVGTAASCRGHYADSCDWGSLEGDCDFGFREDEPVIDSGEYAISWSTRNVQSVTEDCHNYSREVNLAGDSGEINFNWDGPVPGYESSRFYEPQTCSGEGIAPYGGDPFGGTWSLSRRSGTYHCSLTAHGLCGKTVTIDYSYHCTMECR